MLHSTSTSSQATRTREIEETHLDQVLSTPHPPRADVSTPAVAAPSVVVGRLIHFSADGIPSVDYAGCPGGRHCAARSTVELTPSDMGRDVVLAFESGDLNKPIIMGVVQPPRPLTINGLPVVADADGDRLELTSEKEVTIRCGKASITLTRAGKVLIRGAYVSSRSSGANRIKGGSVQIN